MATSKNTDKDDQKAASKTEKDDVKSTAKTEKDDQKAASKTEKDDVKATSKTEKTMAKVEKAASKTEKDTREEEPVTEEVTPVAPMAFGRVMVSDEEKVAAQDGPRATAQDAPMGIPMGAVNDSAPNATVNRFSGVYPNNTYPLVNGKLDAAQEQLKQARAEGARTPRVSSAAPLVPHPPLASKYTTNDHAARRIPPVVSTATRVLRATTRVALAVGNTLIPVTSTTDILVGDLVTLSRGLAAQESVTVTVVDTDATGPRIQIGAPGVKYAHASGATVHEYNA